MRARPTFLNVATGVRAIADPVRIPTPAAARIDRRKRSVETTGSSQDHRSTMTDAHETLAATIEAAFRDRAAVSAETRGEVREAVDEALGLLDRGALRVAERREGDGPQAWHVNQWLKKAVLLSFRLNEMTAIPGGPGGSTWWDKVPSKFDGWGPAEHAAAGFRSVPNCVVRRSAYIAPGVVLMPSFVNLGAYVDSGTMVDTWSTVGSCAQIGRNVHLSGGVGIGGVLEPLQANPTIIEDDCFIGARSRGRRRRRRRPRCGDRDGGPSSRPRPRSSTARRARRTSATCRPIRSWCRAICRASRCPTARRARRSTAP